MVALTALSADSMRYVLGTVTVVVMLGHIGRWQPFPLARAAGAGHCHTTGPRPRGLARWYPP
jgi:hypothetical protein